MKIKNAKYSEKGIIIRVFGIKITIGWNIIEEAIKFKAGGFKV